MRWNKKGVIDQLGSLIVPLVAIAIVLAIGFLIMAEVKTQVQTTENAQLTNFAGCNLANGTGCSSAENGTNQVVDSMEDIPGWLPIIIITVIGALLISLVAVFRRR